MKDLTLAVKDLAKQEGAALVGIATKDSLSGPECSDPTYLLSNAKTAVVFAISINRDIIRDYLGKKGFASRDAMSLQEGEIHHSLWRIGQKLTDLLHAKGYDALNAWPNKDYRETKSGSDRSNPFGLTPEFSHRYAAVAAGLGGFGWSSNVVTPEYGAAVYFSSVLTSAPLEGDSPLPKTPCDECRLCALACQGGFIQQGKEIRQVDLGGEVYFHGRNAHLGHCVLCCGGWINRYQYEEWSSFAPLKVDFPFPNDPNEFPSRFREMFIRDLKGPESRAKRTILHHLAQGIEGLHAMPLEKYKVVCGNCQLMCWKNKKDRVMNLKIIQSSGTVTLDSDDNEIIVRDGRIVDRRV